MGKSNNQRRAASKKPGGTPYIAKGTKSKAKKASMKSRAEAEKRYNKKKQIGAGPRSKRQIAQARKSNKKGAGHAA